MKKVYTFILCLSLCLSVTLSVGQNIIEVSAVNLAFTPKTFSAAVGDIVRFRYVSGSAHTTTSSSVPAGAATWDAPLTTANSTFDYAITTSGTYTYLCKPHAGAGMVGSFVVNAVAPVKMIDFKATTTALNSVRINWKTVTEVNADHFTIESSNDGMNFKEAGRVTAAGNSTAELSYSFTVTVPSSGSNQRYMYFRISTVDKDSKQQFSDIVLCKLRDSDGKSNLIIKLFPIPAYAGDHLNIQFNADLPGTMYITLIDVNGRTLTTIPLSAVTGYNQTHLPLPDLKRGAYYLRFDFAGKKEFHPVVIK